MTNALMCVPQLDEEKILIQNNISFNGIGFDGIFKYKTETKEEELERIRHKGVKYKKNNENYNYNILNVNRIVEGDALKYLNSKSEINSILIKISNIIPKKYLNSINTKLIFALGIDTKYLKRYDKTKVLSFNSRLIEFSDEQIDKLYNNFIKNYRKNAIKKINTHFNRIINKEIKDLDEIENLENDDKNILINEIKIKYNNEKELEILKIIPESQIEMDIKRNYLWKYHYGLYETSNYFGFLKIEGNFFELSNKIVSFMIKYNEIHKNTFSEYEIKMLEQLFIKKSNCDDFEDYLSKKAKYLIEDIDVSDHIQAIRDDYEKQKIEYAKKMGIKL